MHQQRRASERGETQNTEDQWRETKTKEDPGAPKGRKVGKSRNTVFFPMLWGSGGSKSRLDKAAGAEPSGEMRDKRRRLHAFAARNTFWNLANTPPSENFRKLRCERSGRGCGTKHMSKSKFQKRLSLRALLEGYFFQKCMPLRLEAHLEAKMPKAPECRSTCGSWGVKKCTALWHEANFRRQNWKKISRTNFERYNVEKMHDIVVQSACRIQMVKSHTTAWRLSHHISS